ncbi:helix-turn-helix domain-containing protein [Paenibacillus terrae]|uniref:DNA-binding protein n=1 Tax=Paenibacillus terrae TaxID=159743 RepID=A0A0D7WX42_9BACL|nr:helix-turn-helix transcriptional regulator [Paenibacillus terrae]KJD43288.1 DNA-binding protein [Paenibacillus terrae]
MEITPTIRAELDKYLKREGITLTGFGHIAGMNPGTVSGIVSGNRPISTYQLDRITKGMNLPPDHFYDLFVEELVVDVQLNWRRISPFLYRCVQFNRLDCLKKVVSVLLDNPNYARQLFKLAEDSFRNGYGKAATYLYEKVAENERQQHSERLAVCQYRLFQLAIGKDQNLNLKAATIFETFVNRLNEWDQLDALKDLANLYRSLSEWDKVYNFSHQLGQLGRIQYDIVHNSDRKEKFPQRKPSSGPLFAYIAYAELMCAHASDAIGDHERALEHIRCYTDLGWVKETDSDTLHWVGQFQQWAKINTYVNRLMTGDVSVLSDYAEYISGEKHIFNELLNIVEAANKYNIDVDHILHRFEPKIASYQEPSPVEPFLLQQQARFWYKMAKYSFNKEEYSYGFKCLIDALEKSATINHVLLIANCVGLFFHFKTHAAPGVQTQFQSIYEEVWEKNDKKDGFNLSGS